MPEFTPYEQIRSWQGVFYSQSPFSTPFVNKCAKDQISSTCEHTEKAIWKLDCEVYIYEYIYNKSIFTICNWFLQDG